MRVHACVHIHTHTTPKNMILAFCKCGIWASAQTLEGPTVLQPPDAGERSKMPRARPGWPRAVRSAQCPGGKPGMVLACWGFVCFCLEPLPGREFLQLPPRSRATGSARSDTGLGLGSGEPGGALVCQCSWFRVSQLLTAILQLTPHQASTPLSHCAPQGFSQWPLSGSNQLLSGAVGGIGPQDWCR